MIGTARIVGFALIATTAFGAAAGIAAMAERPVAGETAVVAQAGFSGYGIDEVDSCTVVLGGEQPVELNVPARQTLDVDTAGGSGMTVSCGAVLGESVALDLPVSEVVITRGDRI